MTRRPSARVARLEHGESLRAARRCPECRGTPAPVIVWESRLPWSDEPQPRPRSCPACGAKAPSINVAFRKRGGWNDAPEHAP